MTMVMTMTMTMMMMMMTMTILCFGLLHTKKLRNDAHAIPFALRQELSAVRCVCIDLTLCAGLVIWHPGFWLQEIKNGIVSYQNFPRLLDALEAGMDGRTNIREMWGACIDVLGLSNHASSFEF
jgi:hypothetical protein